MTKWTIGMVNYHSSVYIKWQLKILYEFNNERNFKLIIVDNSQNNDEFDKLQELCKEYINVNNNIDLIQHKPIDKTASGQHGEGLDIIKNKADSTYLITQDPDFFWLKQNYLEWLEYLMQFNDAVGIPYPHKVIEGQEYFPGSFGCSYKLEKIKDSSFMPYINNDVDLSWKEFNKILDKKKDKQYDFSYDVGWQVRKKLSKNNNYNFISFSQKNIFDLLSHIQGSNIEHSFESLSTVYFYNNELVACHLFRGTFTGKVIKNADPKSNLDSKIYDIRNKIANFLYQVGSGQKSKEFYKHKHLNNKVTINFSFLNKADTLWMLLFVIKKIKILNLILPVKSRFIKSKMSEIIKKTFL